MPKGRKPKPSAKKHLEGNPGKRKVNRREPKPKISANAKPAAPHALNMAPEGAAVEMHCRVFAERYLPQLQAMGVYTDVDQAAFELLTVHYALAWSVAEVVEHDGLTVDSIKGGE